MKKEILILAREIKAYIAIAGRSAHLLERGLSDDWFGLASLNDIAQEILKEQILHGAGTWMSQISNEDLLRMATKLLEGGSVAWDFEEKVLKATKYIKRQQEKIAA